MAAQFTVPSGKTVYRARYENFKGVDFTSDPMRIDSHRFPDAENLMLDTNGYPEKRYGFRKAFNVPGGGHVKQMVRGVIDGVPVCLMHAGTSILAYTTENGAFSFQLAAPALSAKTFSAYAGGNRLFCFGMTTEDLPYFRVFKKTDSQSGAYGFFLLEQADLKTPTVTVMRTNKNTDGAALEAVNLLSQKRRITYSLTEEDLALEGAYDFLKSYSVSPVLHLGAAADGLNLSGWKELALRFYYTGAAEEDSDVKAQWESVYGTEWAARQSAWYRAQSANKEKALYEFYRSSQCSPAFLPAAVQTAADGTLETKAIPPVEQYTNGSSGEKYAVCCMISDVFSDSNDVYFSLFAARLASSVDSKGTVLKMIDFVPDVNVKENMEITYVVSDEKQSDNLKKVCGGTVCAPFGVGGAGDRVFIAGFESEKNVIRYSEMEDFLYFPDTAYITAGSANTCVLSLFPVGGYLCAAKETNGQDVNLFLIEGSMQDGAAVFLVREGVAGTGISANNCAALVEDEPHFLSENGVFSLVSSDITARKTVVNRSYFADPKIRTEPKAGARLFYYNSLLLLSFPESGHIYVFNTRDKTYFERAGGEHYIYECWLWTGIFATAFFKEGDALFFGTSNGAVMRFNSDLTGIERFRDYSDTDSGGNEQFKPICAYFKTGAFDDGSFMTLKNMQKRGCGVLLKPFTRSSAEISVLTDSGGRKIKDLYADIFDWTYIDFTRVEFSANPAIRIMPFNTKVKKYATIQFIVRNNVLGESFGVIGIEKAYTLGNYKKN